MFNDRYNVDEIINKDCRKWRVFAEKEFVIKECVQNDKKIY